MQRDAAIRQLGPYELLDQIGSGRVSQVFRARPAGASPLMPAQLALKCMPTTLPGAPRWPELFVAAAHRAAQLRHANIVQVLDFGSEGDCRYLAMELVEGYDLAWVLERRAEVPAPIALGITLEICEALGYCHQLTQQQNGAHACAHGSIRPPNVLLMRSGSSKLADFGIGEALRIAAGLTDDALAGAYGYMAPEQLRGDAVDQRADTFALGVLLYEMLCGKPPFKRFEERHAMIASLDGSLLPPSHANAAVPRWLDEVVVHALCAPPRDRFESAAELAQALRQCAKGSCDIALPEETATWIDDIAAEFEWDDPDTAVERMSAGRLHGLIQPAEHDVLAPEPALVASDSGIVPAESHEFTLAPEASIVEDKTLASFDGELGGLSEKPTAPQAEIVRSELDGPDLPLPAIETSDAHAFEDETETKQRKT